ncbi:MAG: hypothetical protein WCI97_00365 [Bacteroidota bacterium]
MNKVKIIGTIAIVLLAINIFWVWFFITHKPPGRNREPKKVIIEKLHLDETQKAAYEKLIDAHRQNMQQSEHEMMQLKNQLYASLQEGKQEDLSDSIINEIGKVQIEIEHVNYKHFQDIKKLCKPEQLKSFDELCLEIAKLFAPPHPPENEKN